MIVLSFCHGQAKRLCERDEGNGDSGEGSSVVNFLVPRHKRDRKTESGAAAPAAAPAAAGHPVGHAASDAVSDDVFDSDSDSDSDASRNLGSVDSSDEVDDGTYFLEGFVSRDDLGEMCLVEILDAVPVGWVRVQFPYISHEEVYHAHDTMSAIIKNDGRRVAQVCGHDVGVFYLSPVQHK